MEWRERYIRKWSCPMLRYYTGICLERPRKAIKRLSQDNQFPSRDLNPVSPEYETRVLTTRFRRSV